MSIKSLERNFSSLSLQPKQNSFTSYLLLVSEQVGSLMSSLGDIVIKKSSASAFKDRYESKFAALRLKTSQTPSNVEYLDLAELKPSGKPKHSLDPLNLELPCIISGETSLHEALSSVEKKSKEIQTRTILDRLQEAFRLYVYPTLNLISGASSKVLDENSSLSLPKRTAFFVKEKFNNIIYFTKACGSGSFGQVFELKPKGPGHRFALKVAKKSLSGVVDHACSALANEAVTLLQTNHPHIISLHAITEVNPHGNGLMMSFVEGKSLDVESRSSSYSRESLLQHLKHIASALSYLHKCHIVHKDIKPSNIMIDENNQAILLDFGLSRLTKDCYNFSGSIAYMAPELGRPIAILDATEKVDVYAFGVLLFEILTGGEFPYPKLADEKKEAYYIRMSKMTFKKPCDPALIKSHLSGDKLSLLAQRDPSGQLMNIAVACLHGEPSSRPSMAKVEKMLAQI